MGRKEAAAAAAAADAERCSTASKRCHVNDSSIQMHNFCFEVGSDLGVENQKSVQFQNAHQKSSLLFSHCGTPPQQRWRLLAVVGFAAALGGCGSSELVCWRGSAADARGIC